MTRRSLGVGGKMLRIFRPSLKGRVDSYVFGSTLMIAIMPPSSWSRMWQW